MLLKSSNQFPLHTSFGGDEFAPNYRNQCGKCASRVTPSDLFGVHLDELKLITAEEALSAESDDLHFTEVPICHPCARGFSGELLFSIY